MKRIILTLTLIFLLNYAYSQCEGWSWPNDTSTAKEKYALYTDAVKNSQFLTAVKPHRWLLQNAPNLNTSIYIHGTKIFSGLADIEKNPVKKQEWIDSLMMMYDMRIEYCGEKEDVMNRKAYDAYKYNIREKEKLPDLLKLYDYTFELNDKKVDYYIALPYMHTIYQNVKQLKNMDQEEIYKRYEKLASIIDYQIGLGNKNKPKLVELKDNVDKMFTEIYDVNCDFVRQNMGPKFKANPGDLDLAKKIFGFMLAGKCTDDPLWLDAAKKIQNDEPEFGLAKNIALKCVAKKDYSCAEKYFIDAISLTQDPIDQADIYMSLGKMKEHQDLFPQAREQYLMAVQTDPSRKEAYKNIGLLYYSSFNKCKKEEDQVQDRAVFLAAYDMFERAGDSKLMQSAKEQFPSKTEMFERDYRKGKTIDIGCWINETSILRARDE